MDSYLFNVHMPLETSTSYIKITEDTTNSQVVIVPRSNIYNLPLEITKNRGVYVLVSDRQTTGNFILYVGLTDGDFLKRLNSHNQQKDFWSTAFLFSKPSNPLNSEKTKFLEGYLVEKFTQYPNVTITNIAKTGNSLFRPEQYPEMMQYANILEQSMVLRGYRQIAVTEPNISPVRQKPVPSISFPSPPRNEPEQIFSPTQEVTAPQPPQSSWLSSIFKKQKPVNTQLSDKEIMAELKKIAKSIRDANPELVSTYSLWASQSRLASIVERRPKTLQQLSSIKGIGVNLCSESEKIIKLFK